MFIVKFPGSRRLAGHKEHLHSYCYFTEFFFETVGLWLLYSCRSSIKWQIFATLVLSIIRAAVYQGLLFFFFNFPSPSPSPPPHEVWGGQRRRMRDFYIKNIFLVDTGQEADFILGLLGFAKSCVFGKQSKARFAEFLKKDSLIS